jgi:hypothetical protein
MGQKQHDLWMLRENERLIRHAERRQLGTASCIHNRGNTKPHGSNCINTRWDFRFSRRRVWRWLSSGMLHCVVWYKFTDVSVVGLLVASFMMIPEDSHPLEKYWRLFWGRFVCSQILEHFFSKVGSCMFALNMSYLLCEWWLLAKMAKSTVSCVSYSIYNDIHCCYAQTGAVWTGISPTKGHALRSQPSSWRRWNWPIITARSLRDMYESSWVRTRGWTWGSCRCGSRTGQYRRTTGWLHPATERHGRWLAFLLRIWEIPGSNLDPKIGYPDWGFLRFSSVSSDKCRYSAFDQVTTASFNVLSYELFTTNPIIRRCIILSYLQHR